MGCRHLGTEDRHRHRKPSLNLSCRIMLIIFFICHPIFLTKVIAVINSGLKILLDWFLVFEKHWTRSGVERTYAVLTFASQFLNSAVVLLLVNAAPLRDAATRSESSAVRTSTLRSFLLNGEILFVMNLLSTNVLYHLNTPTIFVNHFLSAGRYNDFSQGWYEDVGVPILILMLINLTNPLMTLWADQVRTPRLPASFFPSYWLIDLSISSRLSRCFNDVLSFSFPLMKRRRGIDTSKRSPPLTSTSSNELRMQCSW